MRGFTVVIACLLFLQNTMAQNCGSERYLSNIFQSSVIQDVVYGNAPALTAVYVAENVTVNQDMTMDIYLPVGDGLQQRPAVMLAYGGGYLVGSKEDEDVAATCDSLAKKGYVTASINYRMNLNALDPSSAVRAIYRAAQDYHAAIRFMKEYAVNYRIDTNYIFIGGVSAGGFSAMHAAFLDDNERPQATFQGGLLGGVPDLGCIACAVNNYNHSADVRGIINLWGALLDTAFIQQDELVPMTLFHGTNDLIVPYDVGVPFTALFLMPDVYGSEQIATHVNNLGGNAELNTYPGVGHNVWGVNVNNQLTPGPTEYWTPITDSIISFLYENIRPEQPQFSFSTPACSADTTFFQVLNMPQNGRACWSIEQGVIVSASADSSEIGVLWQTPGSHTVSVVVFNHLDAASVSSFQSVSVFISPVVSINDLGGTLTASGNYPSYQWYLNGIPVVGADQQSLSVLTGGTYTVEAITSQGCSAFSDPIVLVGNSEIQTPNSIVREIQVFDTQGKLLQVFSSETEFYNHQWANHQLLLVRMIGEDGKTLKQQRIIPTSF